MNRIIRSIKRSKVIIKEKYRVGANCIIGGNDFVNIVIGNGTSIQANMFMLSEKCA